MCHKWIIVLDAMIRAQLEPMEVGAKTSANARMVEVVTMPWANAIAHQDGR